MSQLFYKCKLKYPSVCKFLHDQLTPVKTGYLLTSSTWSYLGLKFTAYRGHKFLIVDNWIASSCQINLLKTEQDCSEAGFKFKI